MWELQIEFARSKLCQVKKLQSCISLWDIQVWYIVCPTSFESYEFIVLHLLLHKALDLTASRNLLVEAVRSRATFKDRAIYRDR
jgi:hypothetical protein